MHAGLELPLLLEHLATPAHDCFLQGLVQHIHALAKPQDVDAPLKVLAVCCRQSKGGADAQPLLLKAGHGLDQFWRLWHLELPPRDGHNALLCMSGGRPQCGNRQAQEAQLPARTSLGWPGVSSMGQVWATGCCCASNTSDRLCLVSREASWPAAHAATTSRSPRLGWGLQAAACRVCFPIQSIPPQQ